MHPEEIDGVNIDVGHAIWYALYASIEKKCYYPSMVDYMADRPNAVEEVARFLVSAPSPEAIIAFHPSDAASARLYELIDAEREQSLNPEEEQELNNYIALEYFMEQIKAEAHRRLAQKAS
jgi:hypothetical protein